MNLARALVESATKQPEKIALYWGDSEYRYLDLVAQADYIAAKLRQLTALQPGDRVGLWLKNCPEFIPSFFGILLAQGIVVPINSFLKSDEVAYILQDAQIDVLITDAELGVHHRALEATRPKLKILRIENFAPPAINTLPSVDLPPQGKSDLAVLIYTSGTTGRPKGAMLSHGNLLHNAESCRIVLKIVSTDRIGILLPLFHSYMLTVGMLVTLVVGGSIILIKSLHPVRNVLQELIRRRATMLPAIPQFYRSMANLPGSLTLPLRLFVSGAAPLPTQVLHDFENKYHIPLIEGYGLSEASPVVTKNPLDGTRKPGSIGLAIPNVEVSIQDDSGRHLPDGEIGELCVRGGNVMLGYWRNAQATAQAMRGDWLLTGDIAYRDSQGYYFITDRKKDMLLVNGINVYPREIEEVIYQFPNIKEAAVIGEPDRRKGERPVAFVALNDGATLDERELHNFLRRKLADYKVPRTITLMPALPRNATGKILKTTLRQLPKAQTALAPE